MHSQKQAHRIHRLFASLTLMLFVLLTGCEPPGELNIDPERLGEIIEENGGDCDKDDDGHRATYCGGEDCDDRNAEIGPHRDEVVGNGIDDNCNDVVDERPNLASDDFGVVLENQVIELDVLANDGQWNEQPLELVNVSMPEAGEAIIRDGQVSYQAPERFNGTDVFEYTARDEEGVEHTAQVFITVYTALEGDAPVVMLPKVGIRKNQVAVLVNDLDEQSVAVAEYYVAQRNIPEEHVIHFEFPYRHSLSSENFELVKARLEQLPDLIQGYVVTWSNPIAVGDVSVPYALGVGCESETCFDAPNYHLNSQAYFDSRTTTSWQDNRIRPTMMLAGESAEDVFVLIDRGTDADRTFPEGTGHFIKTTDFARRFRWPAMQETVEAWSVEDTGVALEYHDFSEVPAGRDGVFNQESILFYLTGNLIVPGVNTNEYLPGALADHVTSYGGNLFGSPGHMSILRWLEAGVTASHGNFREPYAREARFSEPEILTRAYFQGHTAMTAYWNAVRSARYSMFVGEPLAAPWGGPVLSFDQQGLVIDTTVLEPGVEYELVGMNDLDGPVVVLQEGVLINHPQRSQFVVANAGHRIVQLREVQQGRVTLRVLGQFFSGLSVSSEDGLINECGTGGPVCEAEYLVGQEVVLVAENHPDYQFIEWGVPECGNELECRLVLDRDRTITPRYSARSLNGSRRIPGVAAPDNDGRGTCEVVAPAELMGRDCRGLFPAGAELTVRATPEPEHVFLGFSVVYSGVEQVDCGDGFECAFTLDRNYDLRYGFNTHYLSVDFVDTGWGIISSLDGRIDGCMDWLNQGTCETNYSPEINPTITLRAEWFPEFTEFLGWSIEECGAEPECTFDMDRDREVTAHFRDFPPEEM